MQVIVLCGEGKHFCAGLDFSAFMNIMQELGDPALCPGQVRSRLMQNIRFMQVCIGSFCCLTRSARIRI